MDSNSLDNWFNGKLSTIDNPLGLGIGINSSGYRNDSAYNTLITDAANSYNSAVGTNYTPEQYDQRINPDSYYTRWTDAGVNNLYNTLFGRQADQGGFDYWTNLAKTNGYDYNQIKSAMMNTPEYLNSVSTPTVTNTYNNNNTYTPQTAANITGTSSPVPTNTQPLVDTSPANTFRPFNFSFKPQVQPEYHTQQSLIGSFNK